MIGATGRLILVFRQTRDGLAGMVVDAKRGRPSLWRAADCTRPSR
jgi:hypothetical protein